MYSKRVKILISLILLMAAIAIARLIQMQLISASTFQNEISKLKLHRTKTKQFKTIRGRILDRNGLVLAESNPKFQLNISYDLCSALDQRLIDAKLAQLKQKQQTTEDDIAHTQQEFQRKAQITQDIITKCTHFRISRQDIRRQIDKINNKVWNMRYFLAWARNNPNKKLIEKYGSIIDVPFSIAIRDFEKTHPNLTERLILANKVNDIAEMKKPYKLLELNTNSDIFTAQLEFMNIKQGLDIVPSSQRIYHYNSTACQLIGWIGPENDSDLFDDDKLLAYKPGDLSGRRPGIEYVCEPILRGRRGKELYDIDKQLIRRTQSQLGADVTLTIDIELQQRIEQYITDINYNPNAKSPTSVVIIDTNTGEILAMVSTPTYDLNTIRTNYSQLLNDKNRPLTNRTINALYPPGSVVKPLIAIAGFETSCITVDTIIHCPAHEPPVGWPRCWIQKKYNWVGHDDQWQNNPRNALKGSCNIFFSRLADKIETRTLQKWLYDLGYGHHLLSPPSAIEKTPFTRQLIEADGIIASKRPKNIVTSFDQIGFLETKGKRLFGIGQYSLRVTPLQVAASMSIIANKGIYRKPVIIKNETYNPVFMDTNSLSFDIVSDGMNAVVNETDGTAVKIFAPANFPERDVKVYGKTGSTESPINAWFAGFANDSQKRSIAFAVIVEGGEHGSTDAGPIASEIITLCIDAGYIGKTNNQSKPQ
ncbi:MAG: hypothetical protein KAS96_07900 [Planctomycetes bacterium]|nr:hypothetical protein [Planctomycetota bacterium]